MMVCESVSACFRLTSTYLSLPPQSDHVSTRWSGFQGGGCSPFTRCGAPAWSAVVWLILSSLLTHHGLRLRALVVVVGHRSRVTCGQGTNPATGELQPFASRPAKINYNLYLTFP
jgi:hypothetical protein